MNTPIPFLARALIAASAFFTCTPRPLMAQGGASIYPENGDYLMLTFTTVKPDRVAEFERLQKEELNPALRKAGVTKRLASTRAFVGEGYLYVFGTPLKNFAVLDEEPRLERALGAAAAKALVDRLQACHTSTRTMVVHTVPDLSWGLETPMPHFVVTAYQLVNGRKAEWMAFQREVAAALRQGGVAAQVVQETIYGGDTNLVYKLSRFDRFAELDGNRLRDIMGEEAYAKLMAKRPTAAVVRVEHSLAQHRLDLSIVPEPKTKPAE